MCCEEQCERVVTAMIDRATEWNSEPKRRSKGDAVNMTLDSLGTNLWIFTAAASAVLDRGDAHWALRSKPSSSCDRRVLLRTGIDLCRVEDRRLQ